MAVGRKMSVRESYDKDAQFLLSFKDAVSRDDTLDPKWRDETCVMVANLVTRLLNPQRKGKQKQA